MAVMPDLGVYSVTQGGRQVGVIRVVDGRFTTDPPDLMDLVRGETWLADDVEDGYRRLDGWSNGYVWVKPLSEGA